MRTLLLLLLPLSVFGQFKSLTETDLLTDSVITRTATNPFVFVSIQDSSITITVIGRQPKIYQLQKWITSIADDGYEVAQFEKGKAPFYDYTDLYWATSGDNYYLVQLKYRHKRFNDVVCLTSNTQLIGVFINLYHMSVFIPMCDITDR